MSRLARSMQYCSGSCPERASAWADDEATVSPETHIETGHKPQDSVGVPILSVSVVDLSYTPVSFSLHMGWTRNVSR